MLPAPVEPCFPGEELEWGCLAAEEEMLSAEGSCWRPRCSGCLSDWALGRATLIPGISCFATPCDRAEDVSEAQQHRDEVRRRDDRQSMQNIARARNEPLWLAPPLAAHLDELCGELDHLRGVGRHRPVVAADAQQELACARGPQTSRQTYGTTASEAARTQCARDGEY